MKVRVIGAGPGGLYAALLLKKGHPSWEVDVFERNPRGATYGWGVVFSDRTLTALREADYASYTAVTDRFVTWEAIDVFFRDAHLRCGGHAFAGVARRALLAELRDRAEALGVTLAYEVEIEDPTALAAECDLVIAADGVNSRTREALAEHLQPSVEHGNNRFIWLGTERVFDSFTFIFRVSEHGLFQVHAYPFDGTTSTFIVECAEDVWRAAGLDEADEAESLAFCEALFADHLQGHPLLSNHSRWIRFPTVRARRWRHENIVLLGDAVHTAHFSIGSGTKLAMEDAIALANGFEANDDLDGAVNDYVQARRPRVEGLQEAATESQTYFESVRRYLHFAPQQFAFHLMTRSGRIGYDNLRLRDPSFVADVDRWFAATKEPAGPSEERADGQAADERTADGPTADDPADAAAAENAPWLAAPTVFTPLALRGRTLVNRLVVPAAVHDDAADGHPSDDQRAALVDAARAGAGLALGAPVAVSADGRITSGDPGLYDDAHSDAWSDVVERAKAAGDSALGVTLVHAGRRGATRPRGAGTDRPLRDGWPLLAASPIPFGPHSATPRAMTAEDMAAVRDEFARAAERAAVAGFDLLALHAGHGYLLAGFLSPLANQRDDTYGGALEDRLRFPLEVIDAVRAAWPADKPLAAVLTADDWHADGLGPDDAVVIARAMAEHGVDLFAVVAGQTTFNERPSYDARTMAAYSDHMRNEARVPTLSTGHIRTTDAANTLVAAGRADLCLIYPS